jgi:hypothetical protein
MKAERHDRIDYCVRQRSIVLAIAKPSRYELTERGLSMEIR